MEKLWIKFSVNPPPDNTDILVCLGDKSCAVGRKDWMGQILPVNVHAGDDEVCVYFDSDPIAWQALPLIDGRIDEKNNPAFWKQELINNGWEPSTSTMWKSPDGSLYRGPYQAWKLMKAEKARRELLDIQEVEKTNTDRFSED